VAAVATQVLTSVTKFSLGRLRPHFLDVCRPSVNLTSALCHALPTSMRYVEHFVCESGDLGRIQEARLSFFSGHSSMSMCAAVYIVVRKQEKNKFHLPEK
jgi:phosphatidate phosphatase